MSKRLTLVAAIGRNRAIGLDGRMPWHLPGELQHFKRVTMGKAVIMGRKTWESIGRPLPGRQNIVVSRNKAYRADGASVVPSLDDALREARGEEVMLIGGGELYRQGLPMASRMMLTLVDCEPEADTWFPRWEPEEWVQRHIRRVEADESHAHAFDIVELERISASGL